MGLLFPTPGDLPNPGIEPVSLVPPTLAGGFFITMHLGSPCNLLKVIQLVRKVPIFILCYRVCYVLGSNSGPCGYTVDDGQKKMMDKQGEIENNIYSISYGDKSMWKIGGGKREWMVLEEVYFF